MKNFVKGLFITNSFLTLPFGIMALIIPQQIFQTYGINLSAGGELIARGYGATLVSYGLIYFLFRNIENTSFIKSLLTAATFFNLIEAIIQITAAIDGIVNSVIWVTISLHILVTLLCMVSLISRWEKQ